MNTVGKWKIATYILALSTVGSLWYGQGEADPATQSKASTQDASYAKRMNGLSRLRLPAAMAGIDEGQLLRDLKGASSLQEITLLCQRLGIFGTDRALADLETLSRRRSDATGVALMAMGGIGTDEATDHLIRIADGGRANGMYWAVRALAKTNNRRAHAQIFDWTAAEHRPLKLAAIDALGEVGGEEALEILITTAEDTHQETLRRVIGAAGTMASPGAIALMMDIADRSGRQIRMVALRSMPRSLQSNHEEWLMDVLTGNDLQCAGLAAEALGRAKSQDSLPLLMDAARSGDRGLRTGAIRGLSSLGGEGVREALQELFENARPDEAYEIGRALLDLGGEEGRKSFLAAMRKGHPARAQLISLLHDFTGEEAHALRMEIMTNGNQRERQSVMQQLLGSDDPAVADVMLQLAKTGSRNDRYTALNYLAQSSSKESQRAILDIARGGGHAATEALRMLGDNRSSEPEVQGVLIDALYSGVPARVQTAGMALASSGSEAGRTALLGALSSDNAMLANAAMNSVGQLGGGPEVMEALQKIATESDNAQLKSSALYQLANSADPEATELVVRAISSGDPMAGSMVSTILQRGGEDAKKVTEIALASESAQTRAALANALGNQGGAEASVMLDTLLEDEDASVKSAAVYALGNIGSEAASTRLVELALGAETSVRATAISALGNTGDPRASTVIAEAIGSGESSLVQTAIYSAHNAGPEVDDALLALTEDTDAELHLRQQAASTLISRGGVDADRMEELRALSMPQSHSGSFSVGMHNQYRLYD